MALFRRKQKVEEDEEPKGDALDRLARMSIEELLEAPEVRYQQTEVEKKLAGNAEMVTKHLNLIHQPGGLAHVKAEADFMDLGAARPYLDALSDLTFTIDEQLPTGDDIFTLWTVTGTHTGELCGVPPSGAPVTLHGITMSVIRKGLIATEYTYWDFPEVTERLRHAAASSS
jgi:predicted ester cyclase